MGSERKFGIDIGGTLAKVAYIDASNPVPVLDFESSLGTIHFASFESRDTTALINFLRSKHFASTTLNVTGGGAFKYSSELESALCTQVQKIDEIRSLQKGFNLVLKEALAPAFTYRMNERKVPESEYELPALLCNIGSGVSIIKLTSESFERVSGTCLGGGTVLGLATAILGIHSYQELLDLCSVGDARNVDLSYEDIYGPGYSDTLAVSLGKVAILDPASFCKEDIAKSLVNMVAYNIGHLASLAAKMHRVNHVYFGGNFIRDHPYIMDRISFGLKYWSADSITPLFLKHDGYFGALGALIS